MADLLNVDRKALFIADHLYRECVLPDRGKRLSETGSISPALSLKIHSARKAFEWAAEAPESSRFFTKAAVRRGIELLMRQDNVQIPHLAGLPYPLWLEQQTKIIIHLCHRSRKNSCAKYRFASSCQARRMMDWEDTQVQDGVLS